MPANDPPKKLQLAVAAAAALAVCAAATLDFPIEPGVKLWGLNPGHDGHPETPQPSGPLAKQDQMAMSTPSRGLAEWEPWPPPWLRAPTTEWPMQRTPLPLWA